MKKGFVYERYDYSFLIKKDNGSSCFGAAQKVFANDLAQKVFANDLVEARPMNEPIGRLFYFEPIRNGVWEVSFNTPTTVTTSWSSTTTSRTDATNKKRKAIRNAYWRKINFFKKIRNINVKKV